jgi:hypothetical protein
VPATCSRSQALRKVKLIQLSKIRSNPLLER